MTVAAADVAAFARDALGIELYPGQRSLLERCIASGRRKWLLALGRRSGKDLMAAIIAIFDAVLGDYSGMLRPGEERFIVVVATRVDQARQFIRVVRELLEHAPDASLRALVEVDGSADEIRLRSGVTIVAMPCSSRATRGLAVTTLILNEAAHMSTADEGWQAGRAVYRALLPATVQFGDKALVIVMSSPLWATGIFWDLFSAGVSGADPTIHVEQLPTWELNPTVTRESLEPEFLADPDSARVEYGAEFAEGAGAFLNATAVHECVVSGRTALPALPELRYVAAADPAFAAGGDAFTFCIAHKVGNTVVLDRLLSWRGRSSPLNSDAVLDEIAAVAHEYRIREVVSDQYAVVPLADGLRRRGVYLRGQPLTNELKADIFTSLKRTLNTGEVELLDDPRLAAELVHLQVRPSPSGKPRISAAAGHHDDLAMVVATVVHDLVGRMSQGRAFLEFWKRDIDARSDPAAAVETKREQLQREDAAATRELQRRMRRGPHFSPQTPGVVGTYSRCRASYDGAHKFDGRSCRSCHQLREEEKV
jgi:hypothetical protein